MDFHFHIFNSRLLAIVPDVHISTDVKSFTDKTSRPSSAAYKVVCTQLTRPVRLKRPAFTAYSFNINVPIYNKVACFLHRSHPLSS